VDRRIKLNQQENVDEVQIGRVLHFVIFKRGRSQCRPALVVEDWPDQGRPGYCNLVVFPDGTNDGLYGTDIHRHHLGIDKNPAFTGIANNSLLVHWETSVLPNHAVKAVGTWHWPRGCSNLVLPAEPFTHPDTKEVAHHNHAESYTDIRNCIACRYASRLSNA
jgi:hypothetical protein